MPHFESFLPVKPPTTVKVSWGWLGFYKLAAIALNAAFLFFDVADLDSFAAADFTRQVFELLLHFADFRFLVAIFFEIK